jgi:AraC-like DNA-binding protein
VSGPGAAAAIFARDGIPFSGQAHHAHYDALTLDRGLLNEVAAASPRHRGEPPVQLTASIPVSQAANKHLVDAIDYLCRDIATNPLAAQTPLIAGAVKRYLAARMLVTYTSTAEPSRRFHRRQRSHRHLHRRHRQPRLRHTRAVQLMFRRHRDCTPMEYLRRVRLHYAHQELLRSDQLRATVTQIAAKWGFAHTGRFAVYYRAVYGRSPGNDVA